MRKKLLFLLSISSLVLTSCNSGLIANDNNVYFPYLSDDITYDKANEKIETAGFTNISYSITDDLVYFDDVDGIVEKITVEGNEAEENGKYKKDDAVVIYYHTFSEKINNYVSPNSYVEYNDYNEENYKELCDNIFKGFTLCYEEISNEGIAAGSKMYYFNFDLKLSIVRYVRYRGSLPNEMFVYDINGNIENGWTIISKGKIVNQYKFDEENNDVLKYDRSSNYIRYSANKHQYGEIDDVGLYARLDCIFECDQYEKNPYTKIYRDFLSVK